jgi:hypothetical protein
MLQSLLVFGGLGGLGFVYVASRLKRTRSLTAANSRGPWLRIEEGAGALPAPKDAPSLWLALATLSPARRSSLLDEIEAAVASVEARSNPLLVDFIEDDLGAVIRRNQRWLLPVCNAASALLASSYEGPDGFRVQVLAPNAPTTPGDVPARKREPEGARERRARFLAWPASRSVTVRTQSAQGARRLEADLRDACADAESSIALVVDRRLLHGIGPEARLDAILGRLAKAPGRVQGDGDLPLVPTTPAHGVSISPWIVLEQNEFLVVPKLGALSPPSRFDSEIERHLRGTDAHLVGS